MGRACTSSKHAAAMLGWNASASEISNKQLDALLQERSKSQYRVRNSPRPGGGPASVEPPVSGQVENVYELPPSKACEQAMAVRTSGPVVMTFMFNQDARSQPERSARPAGALPRNGYVKASRSNHVCPNFATVRTTVAIPEPAKLSRDCRSSVTA
jgi:hypothetical protein